MNWLVSLIPLLPNLVRTVLAGGVLVNVASDQLVTQLTGVTDIKLLITYMVVVGVQLVTVLVKSKSTQSSAK